MITYKTLRKRQRALQAVTGLKSHEFEELAEDFAEAEDRAKKKFLKTQVRLRAPGAGPSPALSSPEDRLLFILVYFRMYPTQDLQGLLFDLSQPWANRWIHRLTPILEDTLGQRLELPERNSIRTLPELFEKFPEMMFVIDGTDRPIQRPKCSVRQKKCYSGKQKRHTVKNTVVTGAKTNKIVMLGQTREGRIHDKRLAEEDGFLFPEGSTLFQDSAYQGYKPPGVKTFFQPKKKPRGGELKKSEKAVNKAISSVRVRVEHAIRGAKRNRIARDTYRNRRPGFVDTVMVVSCGLSNFTTGLRT